MTATAGFEIVALHSGVNTLRCLESGETFHPVVGPNVEARLLHVEQQNLRERARTQRPLVIWDVGLGAAANALAAVEALHDAGEVILHSFDRTTAPLEFALEHVEELVYLRGHEAGLRELAVEGTLAVSPGLRWHFHQDDFVETLSNPDLPAPHAIFFDPYSAVGNPEMWTLDIFTRLHARLPKDELCLLTNYTCSTAVRVSLLLAGFYVGHGTGAGAKVETTIASNRLDALTRPLDHVWLNRVQRSSNAAPLRSTPYSTGPISASDYLALERHPQFAPA